MNSIPKRFLCSHCHQLIRSPVQTQCGHVFCQEAIPEEGLDCPACKDEGEADIPRIRRETLKPDAAITREMNKTKFQCPWKPCTTKLRLHDLKEHAESECQHRETSCKLCGTPIPASAMLQHQKDKCPKRKVECSSCHESVQQDRLKEHQDKECIGSTTQCQSCLARVRDTDADRLEHARNVCPVGWADGQACPFGCGVVEDAQKHRSENVALHTDRMFASTKAKPPTEQQAAGSHSVAEQDVPLDSTASEAVMRYCENVLDMADVTSNLSKYGHPRHPLQTSDISGRDAFFERVKFSETAFEQLDRQRELMSQKLAVTYRAMDPLMRELQKQYEELSAGDAIYKDLLCAMSLKEVRICDLDRSITMAEMGSTDGTLVWKIPFFKDRMSSTEYEPVLFSPSLYTDKFGYKLSCVVYLNGQGAGKDKYISLFARINKGPYDGSLQWPFKQKVTFSLLSQVSPSEHLVKHIQPDGSSQYQRPSQPTGQLFGIEKFFPKDDLESKGYLKDDVIFLKIQVAKPPLRSF